MAIEPKRIVLVDDDADTLDIHRQVLEAAGYEVVCFYDPDTALAYVQEQKPDLVITDLMMKSLDSGFVIAKTMKQDPALARIPVIVVTAIARQRGFDFRPRGPEDMAAMGVAGFLEKPVNPQTMISTVRKCLSRTTVEKA